MFRENAPSSSCVDTVEMEPFVAYALSSFYCTVFDHVWSLVRHGQVLIAFQYVLVIAVCAGPPCDFGVFRHYYCIFVTLNRIFLCAGGPELPLSPSALVRHCLTSPAFSTVIPRLGERITRIQSSYVRWLRASRLCACGCILETL